ncbi:YxeA family protein [Erysipelothrix urinaevulpis]|uniref:YxeA family protein n=1 Tax=Erysipelothrix urinaevulpis TaxID=2683717 RepID=UPI00135B108E|nr:YxeA family protein [Erysipelothrix urinaevulpis]
MSKKIMFFFGMVLFIFILVLGGRYYQKRYLASGEFYVKVPTDQSTEIDPLFNMDGKEVDKGKEYRFTAWDLEGNSRIVEFTFQTEDPQKLLQPGDYVKVETSDTLVLGEKIVAKEDVPQAVIQYLE